MIDYTKKADPFSIYDEYGNFDVDDDTTAKTKPRKKKSNIFINIVMIATYTIMMLFALVGILALTLPDTRNILFNLF